MIEQYIIFALLLGAIVIFELPPFAAAIMMLTFSMMCSDDEEDGRECNHY